MTKMKSLLLGTAAGLVAVAGAQAADMPVKAKPVQYVKICTLYGDGYYYVPGSDICIKIGGYVRADYGWNNTGARTVNYKGASGAQDRTVSDFSTRHRGNLQIDTRAQTQYGTLRTFTSIHVNNENKGPRAPTLLVPSSSSPASPSVTRSRTPIRSASATTTLCSSCRTSTAPARTASTRSPTRSSSATA